MQADQIISDPVNVRLASKAEPNFVGQLLDRTKLSIEGPVSIMTFGLLDFWRFSHGTQLIFGQIEQPSEQSVHLDKTNILLSHLFILDKYNLSSGKIEL